MVNKYNFNGDAKITFSGDSDDIPLGVVHPLKEIHLVKGHNISYLPEAIECPYCDTRVEIPSMMQQSSGFAEVLYRLYIIGDMDVCDGSPTHGGSYNRQSMNINDVTIGRATDTTINNMSGAARTVNQSMTVGDVSIDSDDDDSDTNQRDGAIERLKNALRGSK